MTLILAGQILALAFAAGLNLYLTIAALGVLARIGVIGTLPPGLSGLEGLIVIGTAAILFLVEAVIDKIGHADSVWDTVHTFIRPPAAALLTVAALWGFPATLVAPAAAAAFLVALSAHATKAGLRLALNATGGSGHLWISLAEDLLALALATLAFLDPRVALATTAGALLLVLVFGPRYWRAFRMGTRAMSAWIRTLFRPARWREGPELPAGVRAVLDPTPLGAAPPRGTPAAIAGLPGVGAYRNGWLVLTVHGSVFVYRTSLGYRRADLPRAAGVTADPGVWVNTVTIEGEDQTTFRLFMLKDGPPLDLALPPLEGITP